MLVSVIVPNYNHSKFLDRRIQSVLNQTYKDFELIILDDCSTDDSLAVIEKYKSNPHVREVIVNKINSGNTFKQWQKGIEVSKGDVVWIAESDDYCELTLLEELVNAYNGKRNTVLAYNTTIQIDDYGNEWNELHVGSNQYINGKRYLKSYLALCNYILNASCAIFSREAALSIDDAYQDYKGAGDYLFWVEIAKQGNVAIVNKRLSFFCRHAGTVSDLCGRDGTNAYEEAKVLARISSLVHIGYVRKNFIYAHHANRMKNQVFNSPLIKSNVSSLWHWEKYNGSRLYSFLLKAANHIVKKFNFYV